MNLSNMMSICKFCGCKDDSLKIREKLLVEDAIEKTKDATFWIGDKIMFRGYEGTVIYTEVVQAFPLHGETAIYAKFNDYANILHKGDRVIVRHPRGFFKKCIIRDILFQEEKMKEILVKNESISSPQISYYITEERIDAFLIKFKNNKL